jgi:uncharacterized OB-fold protein
VSLKFIREKHGITKCEECGHEIPDEALVCPNCGKPQKNKPLSTSLSGQMKVYSVSLFLPPFGLWYVYKYLKQKNSKSKKIGIVALILTIISVIGTICLTIGVMNSVNQAMNTMNVYGY